MSVFSMKKNIFFATSLICTGVVGCGAVDAQPLAASKQAAPQQSPSNQATIAIDAGRLGASVSPTLHGIFFEEISHGGEGGLYAELIQNRGFEESRLPPATTLTDGFIVPNRTPHFSLPNNRASDWKMRWELHSQWPAWSLETGDAPGIGTSGIGTPGID